MLTSIGGVRVDQDNSNNPQLSPEAVNLLFDEAQEALRVSRTAEDVDDDDAD